MMQVRGIPSFSEMLSTRSLTAMLRNTSDTSRHTSEQISSILVMIMATGIAEKDKKA